MKLTSIIGKGTGKLGGSVFVVSEGRQIVREYQPKVGNPRTEKQQEQRAKFTGLILLAREFAPSLMYIGRQAGVSERNEFVRRNTGDASIVIDLTHTPNFLLPNYHTLRLTSGSTPATIVSASYSSNNLTVDGNCPMGFDVVKIDVYEFVTGAGDNLQHLVLNGSAVVKATAGAFAGPVPVRAAAGAELLVVAVAMKSNGANEYLEGVISNGISHSTEYEVHLNKKENAAAVSEVSAAGFLSYTVA